MVKGIAAGGMRDERVLAAMATVPRHVFVDRFWGPPDSAGNRAPPTKADLDVIHTVERALPLEDRPGRCLATISAPNIVASMLELLDLRPGLRILEIGTGTGYNAALLAQLVESPPLVTTIEIDPDLAAAAARHLTAAGYAGVDIHVGDGHLGAPGPFDRVIATVGCKDLSPHWLRQLRAGGCALVPLSHSTFHPLVLAYPDGEAWTGELVGRAGFVDVQGYQDRAGPWTQPTMPSATNPDLVYFGGLSDPETPSTVVAAEWYALGSPALTRYRLRFTPHDGANAGVVRLDERRWRITRIDYDQEVTLP
jgi:protein-L-isoaspartate(D-aspartate) O-methyltransferase